MYKLYLFGLGLLSVIALLAACRSVFIFVDKHTTASAEYGTRLQPYKTVRKANDNSLPGDNISISHGNYLEAVTFEKAGTLTPGSGRASIIAPSPPHPDTHLGTDQRVLVICVKFSDLSNTRLPTAQRWVNLLNEQARPYYQRATYNRSTFIFETLSSGPIDGWLQLNFPSSSGFLVDEADKIQQAIDLADPYVNFQHYKHVLIITNDASFYGGSNSGRWQEVSTGVQRVQNDIPQRLIITSMINEWEAGDDSETFDAAASNAAHELGHSLGVRTHYGANISFLLWGIMENSTTPPPHFLGWAKNERSWLDDTNVVTIAAVQPQAFSRTLQLKSHSESPVGGIHLVKIPFGQAGHFEGHVIEYRKNTNYDWVPDEGVLVYYVNNDPTKDQADVWVYPDPNDPSLQTAALEVGDTYVDTLRNIEVEVLNLLPEHAEITIRIGQ